MVNRGSNFLKQLFYIKGQIENYHTHVSFGVFESFSNSPVLPSIGGDMVAGKETGRKTRGGGNSSGGDDKKPWDQIPTNSTSLSGTPRTMGMEIS